MPGLTGIQLQELLATTGRRMSIVFVTGHAERVGLRRGTRRSAAISGSVIPEDLRSLWKIAIRSSLDMRARGADLVTVPSVRKIADFLAPVLEARPTKPHGTPRGGDVLDTLGVARLDEVARPTQCAGHR